MSVSKFSPNTVIAVSTPDLQAISVNSLPFKKNLKDQHMVDLKFFLFLLFCTEYYVHTHTHPMKLLQPYTDKSLKHCMYTSVLTTITNFIKEQKFCKHQVFHLYIYSCFNKYFKEKQTSKQTNSHHLEIKCHIPFFFLEILNTVINLAHWKY